MDSIPAEKVLKKTRLDLQKRFPKNHVCPKMLGGPLLRLALLVVLPARGAAFPILLPLRGAAPDFVRIVFF